MEISLQEANTYLLSAKQKNFFARIIACLTYVEAPGLGTCAVGVGNTGRLCFFYDPEFLKKISMPELILTYEHEVYHLILDHIPRYLDLVSGLVSKEDRRRYKAAMNVAADLAANEMMRQEPNFDKNHGEYFYGSDKTEGRSFLIPETFELKKLQTFEVYIHLLLSKMQKITHKLGQDMELEMYGVPVKQPGGSGKGDQQQQQGKQGQQEQQGSGKGQQEQQKGQEQQQQPGGGGGGQGQQEEPQKGQGDKGKPGQEGGEGQDKSDPIHILETYFNGKAGNAHKFWDNEKQTNEEKQGVSNRVSAEARAIVQNAVDEHQKSRGTIPGGMQELLEKFLAEPTIPWPQILRTLCTRTRQTKLDRGMSRPSRRRHGVPDILPFPGKARDNRFTIIYAVDTSGSMSTDDLKLAAQELLNIVRTEPDVKLHVMYCDAHLHVEYSVENIEDIDLTMVGRGGTDFNPPFIRTRELLKSDEAPDVMVYATDGYAPAPEPENRVPIPVVWLITPGGTIPSPDYGTHITMEPFE